MVGKNQLQLQIRSISQRIDVALRVRHARIVKHANHMRNRIHLTQRGQRIPHPLLLHSAKIDVLHSGIRNFLGIVKLSQLQQPRLRHLRHANPRLLPTLRQIHMRLRQNPEQRRLSNLW